MPLRELTCLCCSWIKLNGVVQRIIYIQLLAVAGTGSDCGNRNVWLEDEMKGEIKNQLMRLRL